jgi:hypothetical protein
MKKMPQAIAGLTVFMACLAGMPPAMSAGLPAPSVDLLKWPRMSSKDFGCYLEKTFGHRDKRFNCSLKRYENKGDVCNPTDAYYEGPAFPDRLAAKVHPLATKVDLDWEHGDLRSATVTLKGTWNEAEVRRSFHLPRKQASTLTETDVRAFPENLMDASVRYPLSSDDSLGRRASNPSRGVTSVDLTGFEHMGAADMECEGDK